MSREQGQMAVELCVTMPVALMIAVVILDSLTFAAACARFDHLAPQAVVAVAGSPAGATFDSGECAGAIQQRLSGELESEHLQVEVRASQDGPLCEFTCKASAAPWPFSAGNASLFGLAIPSLMEHEVKLSVRPYSLGALL